MDAPQLQKLKERLQACQFCGLVTFLGMVTLPKTNIAPSIAPFPRVYFQGLC